VTGKNTRVAFEKAIYCVARLLLRSTVAYRQLDFTYARSLISISSRVAIARLRAPRFYVSSAGGAERHLEVESLCFLEMIDHLEKIASLRIAAGYFLSDWRRACTVSLNSRVSGMSLLLGLALLVVDPPSFREERAGRPLSSACVYNGLLNRCVRDEPVSGRSCQATMPPARCASVGVWGIARA